MLLQKAKVITTPTAYSDGILHSVKPNVVLGDELVVNGTFDTDSNWTKGTGWSISGGSANCDGTQTSTSNLTQFNLGVSTSKTYKVSFDLIVSSGQINYNLFSGTLAGASLTSSGTYTFDLKPSNTTDSFVVVANADFIGSIDNVSVKEKIDADFTFTRNSSATRVGEDGYIQDVQIIGGELVQNGDFEEIGSELVTNGNFDTDSDWTLGADTIIENGKLVINNQTGGNIQTTQNNVVVIGKIYKIQFTISDYISGELRLFNTFDDLTIYNGNGTYVVYSEASISTALKLFSNPNSNYSIDNVSVKEVGQNWNFVGDFETDGTKAFITNASQYSQLTNQFGVNYLLSGRKYRLSFDIPTLSISNAFAYRYTGGSVIPISTSDIQNGRFTAEFTMPSNGYFWLQTTGSYTGLNVEIDNISVKEVTDDTNLPRINYEGFSYENGLPIYGSGKGHFLLEGQSTNQIYYSEEFTNVRWIKNNTITASSVISPDGGTNAYLMSCNANLYNYIFENATQPSGYNYTNSIFIKNNVDSGWMVLRVWNGSGLGANVWFDLTNGVIGTSNSTSANISLLSANAEDYGNGWYRLSVSGNVSSGLAYFQLSFVDGDGASNYTSVSGKSCYIYGAQWEQNQTYATSYIPTNGSAVTRAAETCNNAGNADLFDSEGVFYAEIAALANDGTSRIISISDGSFNNLVYLYYFSNNDRIKTLIQSGGVASFDFNHILSDATDFHKFAVRYKDNDFSFWINGVQVATDTSGTAPIGLNKLQFTNALGSGDNFYGKTKMVGVFPYLSNDEMECLTGEGYGTFQAMALANNYTIIQG